MSSLLDTEEEVRDTEITLSTASLLGIFFGLVLVCGVFFGFGYSMGRRVPDASPAGAAVADSSEQSTGFAAANVKHGKPAALQAQAPPADDFDGAEQSAPAVPEDATNSSAERGTVRDTASPYAATNTTVSPPPALVPAAEAGPHQSPEALATRRPAALKPAAAIVAATAATPSAATAASAGLASNGPAMVQIAAVSRAEDAEVLVSALRRRGYSVVVRREPQDALTHVQVGPFATRAEANAMRQKLMADGYNAIVKQ